VRDAMGTLAGRQTGYIVAGFRGGGSQLIGFADTDLKDVLQKRLRDRTAPA
jgi:hypothetical protein